MNKKEEKSSWDELAKLLGTNPADETTQSSQPESVANLPSERRAPPLASHPVRPRHSDWNVLASELGLSLSAAPPPKTAEAKPNCPLLKSDAPGTETDAPKVKEDVQEAAADIQAVKENVQEPIEPNAEATDPQEFLTATDSDQPAETPPTKETRRRRRGGRRHSPTKKSAQTEDPSVPMHPDADPTPRIHPPSQEGMDQESTERPDFANPLNKPGWDPPDDIPATSSTRKKRRRRGGSRKSRQPAESGAAAERMEESGDRLQSPLPANAPEIPPETSRHREPQATSKTAKSHRRDRPRQDLVPDPNPPEDSAATLPGQHVSEPDSAPKSGFEPAMPITDRETGPPHKDILAPETHRTKSISKRSSHKNIPTWEETIHILIDNNLSSRTPRNRAQRSGSKGGRRGRKR